MSSNFYPGKPDNKLGENLYSLVERLYPICRSITGNGVRETLRIISEHIPLKIHEVPSGQKVFDWEIPDEWNIRDGFIKDPEGKKIVDFKELNLHVLNYSIPVNQKMPLSELKKHLYTLPEHPDWVPYKTSYFNRTWGFCLSHKLLESLSDGEYEAVIDSSLEPGSLTYGELVIKGETEEEVLISTHICHPSLCNDNLSGISVSVYLAKYLMQFKPRFTYRFLFIPGTIGSITWLSLNEAKAKKIKFGLVATLLGDSGGFTYKRSRKEEADINKILENVLQTSGHKFEITPFIPYGYDERQYCSPGFDLPVGCLMRTPFGQFPEYHTSADNPDFINSKNLIESYDLFLKIFEVIEWNKKYLSTNPKCEPQLGKRGLYSLIGGQNESKNFQMALLWVLNQSDGNNSLLDISIKSGIDFSLIREAAEALIKSDLLIPVK